jgi:hypothetical protein
MTKQMDESHLEVLIDLKFQASVDDVKDITLLYTAHLGKFMATVPDEQSGGIAHRGRLLTKAVAPSIFPTVARTAPFLFAIPLRSSVTCRSILVSIIFSLESVLETQVLNWSSHVGVTRVETCGGCEAIFPIARGI